MASVSGNATITICAEAAANGQCGIFKSANDRRGIEVRLAANGPRNSFEYGVYLKAMPGHNDGDFHIVYRAWVLQECLLSPRVIIYAADQVYWSCRAGERSERGGKYLAESRGIIQLGSYKSLLYPTTGPDHGDDKLTQPLAPSRIEKTPLKSKDYLDYVSQHEGLLRWWYKIVKVYARCNITKAEDRLPAIAGIRKQMSALTGFSYVAGLWLEDIVQELCWYSRYKPRTSSRHVGPTWSWVSMTQCTFDKSEYFMLVHARRKYFEIAEDIKIEDINIKYATADEFMQVQEGSSLQITGLCCGSVHTVDQREIVGWGFFMSGKYSLDGNMIWISWVPRWIAS